VSAMHEPQTDPEITCPPYPQRTQPGVNNKEEGYGVTTTLKVYQMVIVSKKCKIWSTEVLDIVL